MIEMAPETVALVGVVGSIGVAYGVVKATNIHLRTWIQGLNRELDQHKIEDNMVHLEVVDRLARIETKIDALSGDRNEGSN